MQKWGQRLLCIAFSLMFLFVCTGYAQFADSMTVTGTAEYKPPEDYVYISSFSVKGTTNANATTPSSIFPTNFKNTVTATKNNASSSIVYEITFKNMSRRYTYEFKGIEAPALDGTNNNLYSTSAGNNNLSVSMVKVDEYGRTSNFTVGTSIAPQQTLTIRATYTLGRNVTKNTAFTFLLNYKFGVHVNSMGAMAVENTLLAFLNALNTPDKYSYLTANIDNKYNNQDWQANYIGNVSQAGNNNPSAQAKEDATIVENMIGSGLTLTIEGVQKNITVLIKRENLDNNERTGDAYKATNGNNSSTGKGCEMSIYMTPNDLDKTVETGEYSGDRNYAEVFVAITTCTNSGVINSQTNNYTSLSDWYQIGDIYEGIANIVTYEGGTGTGSFVTDNWVSITKTYYVTANYSYTIAGNKKLSELMQAVDTNAKKEFDRLLKLAQDEIAYIDSHADYFDIEEYQPLIETLRQAVADAVAMNVNNSTTRVSLIPILKTLENVTYPFQSFVS